MELTLEERDVCSLNPSKVQVCSKGQLKSVPAQLQVQVQEGLCRAFMQDMAEEEVSAWFTSLLG